ncbi:MAG: hypothetical protein LAT81_14265 [Oceanicaulis sp.]|nr:hypothetical protein [Oceanicaulis sp.]
MPNRTIITEDEFFRKIQNPDKDNDWQTFFYKIFNFEVNITDILFTNEIKNLSFYNCEFNRDFAFGSSYKTSLEVKKCEFNENFFFDVNKHDVFNAESAIFNKEIILKEIEFFEDFNINDATFKLPVDFSQCIFRKNFIAKKTKFESLVNWQKSSFKSTIDFEHAEFHKPNNFNGISVDGTAIFSDCSFFENILFKNAFFKCTLILNNASIDKGIDLSQTILSSSLGLYSVIINDFETSEVEMFEEIQNFFKVRYDISINEKIETFRVLKKNMLLQGNRIEYNNLYAKELNLYLKHLRQQIWIKKSFSKAGDLIILGFNYLSNKNGLSPGRAIWFTLITSSFFFCIQAMSTKYFSCSCQIVEEFDVLFKLYIQFLIPTHKIDFLDCYGANRYTYLFNFIGRSLVAYGIYQFIQAFRKFKAA